MESNFITLRQLYQFDNLEVIARQVVEGFIIGLHKSPFHGFSAEFAEHRLYNPGDSVKDIDWKIFARTDRLYIKRFEEETNLRCQLVVDASSSMYFPFNENAGENQITKARFSAVAASALMYMLKKQRDATGLTVFSNDIEVHTRASSTTVHHKILSSHLHNVVKSNERNKETAAAKCLHLVAENINKRSMVVIFSDMFDDLENTEEIFSALQHLKYNKHEVVLFQVVDQKREMEFEFENKPHIFVDLETNEKVKLQPNQVKDYYITKMNDYKKALKLKCSQFEIDFVEADINKDFSQVLLPYLLKRTKMQ